MLKFGSDIVKEKTISLYRIYLMLKVVPFSCFTKQFLIHTDEKKHCILYQYKLFFDLS
jgi:hypothetical protein